MNYEGCMLMYEYNCMSKLRVHRKLKSKYHNKLSVENVLGLYFITTWVQFYN